MDNQNKTRPITDDEKNNIKVIFQNKVYIENREYICKNDYVFYMILI